MKVFHGWAWRGMCRRKWQPAFWLQCPPFSLFRLQQYRAPEEHVQKDPEHLQIAAHSPPETLQPGSCTGWNVASPTGAPLTKLSFIECVHPPNLRCLSTFSLWVTAFKILFPLTDEHWPIGRGIFICSLLGICWVSHLLFNVFPSTLRHFLLWFPWHVLSTAPRSWESHVVYLVVTHGLLRVTSHFSVLFLSLGLPSQMDFVGFTAHQSFIF